MGKIISVAFFSFLFLVSIPGIAAATTWNASWSYQIDNVIANGIRPYQIPLNIHNGTGANTSTDVYISCEAINCSDLRFTLDNTTELPYWWEINASTGVTGKVYVNVTGNGAVNLQYGNPNATYQTNGPATFIQYHGSATANFNDSAIIPPTNIAYEANISRGGTNNPIWGLTYKNTWGTGDTVYEIQSWNSGNQIYGQNANGGTYSSVVTTPQLGLNQLVRIKITSMAGVAHYYINGTEIQSGITTNIPANNTSLGAYNMVGNTQYFSFARVFGSPEPVLNSTWTIPPAPTPTPTPSPTPTPTPSPTITAVPDNDIYTISGNVIEKNNEFKLILLNNITSGLLVDNMNIYANSEQRFYIINKTSGEIKHKINIYNINISKQTDDYVYLKTDYAVYQVNKTSGIIESRKVYLSILNKIYTYIPGE